MAAGTLGTQAAAIAAQLKSLRTGEDLSNRHADELMSSTVEAEVRAGVLNVHTATQREMDLSLRRAAKGLYGICSDCQKEIESKRLAALPHAVRCKDCAEIAEASTSRRSPHRMY